MKVINLYLCGVGGQGIGLLSKVLANACLSASHGVNGCDTHGLAQRHGTVVSHLRLGKQSLTPRVPDGSADLVIGLERLETYRAIASKLRRGGKVVYYDAVYQPISVRVGEQTYPTCKDLEQATQMLDGQIERVRLDDMDDPRMQNVVLLGRLARLGWIQGVEHHHIEQALINSLSKKIVEANRQVFQRALNLV